MPSCSSSTLDQRRARPLLGTYVEIAVHRSAPREATDRAFEVIAGIQRRMSVQDPKSDLGRIAAAPPGEAVRVHASTARVLRAALKLAEYSDGVFDPVATATNGAAYWRDLHLDRRDVSCARPLRVDLSGIAKGYAVDAAVNRLRRHGVKQGIVNAGGDLRVFGDVSHRVHVRDPRLLGTFRPVAELLDGAIATSANYLDSPGNGRLVNPTGSPLWLGDRSVTVCAATCLLADALCKIVAAIGPAGARPLLKRFRATTIVVGEEMAPVYSALHYAS